MQYKEIKITTTLYLPIDETDPVYQFDSKSLIEQTIFDGFTNFVLIHHNREATKWLSKSNEDKTSTEYSIYRYHETWAEMLEKAKTEIEIKQ